MPTIGVYLSRITRIGWGESLNNSSWNKEVFHSKGRTLEVQVSTSWKPFYKFQKLLLTYYLTLTPIMRGRQGKYCLLRLERCKWKLLMEVESGTNQSSSPSPSTLSLPLSEWCGLVTHVLSQGVTSDGFINELKAEEGTLRESLFYIFEAMLLH